MLRECRRPELANRAESPQKYHDCRLGLFSYKLLNFCKLFLTSAFANQPTLDAPWHSNQTFFFYFLLLLPRKDIIHQHFHPWKFDRNLHFCGLSLLFCSDDHFTFAKPKISSRPAGFLSPYFAVLSGKFGPKNWHTW